MPNAFEDRELASEAGSKSKRGPSKTNTKLSVFFTELIDENREQLKKDLQELEPKDRLMIVAKLAEFVEPKKRAVNNVVEMEEPQRIALTDEQASEMIQGIEAHFKEYEQIK